MNSNNLDILIGIVIATFIIAAVYVGYHASQVPQIEEEGELHGIELKPLHLSNEFSQIITVKADQPLII